MLERFFGRRKKKIETEPAISFGRYSDNNKTVEKVNRWTDADNLLKELSTKGDKQDDLLVQDFTSLQTIDTEHIIEVPLQEKEIKFRWLQKWIDDTISYTKTLEADKFSGGIAYLL